MTRPPHPAPRPATLLSRGWLPVDPPSRPVLFVNPRSGDGAAGRHRVVELARGLGIEVRVLGTLDDLRERALRAVTDGADALGMAGGDGSLATVADVAASHALPFVCVPVGTRNHFALDVGVERRDVAGALTAFTDGVERRVDVGVVNGRVFLNNVSLGVYGEAVQRSAYRDAKVRTLAETARRVLAPHGAVPGVHLEDDTGRVHTRIAVVLVSNNPYALAGPAPHTRPTLSGGRLGVLVLDAPDDTARPPGRAWTARHLRIGARAPVPAGVDGEAAEFLPPLDFVVRPDSLRVRISARHPGASPASRSPFTPGVPGTASPAAE